ncbi:hypothetical protein [Actinoplanes sp. NPDC049265]|uniref:hypothetical protein n=1 Tax=Actinoplanes sp. NPDC049265 TaxID=3363902 RepID=UPI003710C8DF
MKKRSAYPLAALAVPALLLSGCGAFSSSSSSSSGSSSASSGSAGGGKSWIVSAQGKATPSPTPTSGGTPSPSVSFGFLPLSGGGGAGYATPTPTCSPNMFNFSRIAGVDVTPSTTTAKLSWYNVGGENLLEFRLYAISQDLVVGEQRDIGYTVVKPRTPCGQMDAIIPKLSPKTHYVFSVDAVVVRRSGDGTHSATVFRSHPIPTL